MSRADELRQDIRNLVSEYRREAFPANASRPGRSSVPVSGRIVDKDVYPGPSEESMDYIAASLYGTAEAKCAVL
jgi:hypothetical protein